MNRIFFFLVFLSFCTTAYRQWIWLPSAGNTIAPMQALTTSIVESANSAVTLSLGMVGMMTLFMGLMKVAEAGGLLMIIARLIRPLMIRLFPDVPADHPAMGAMIMNLAANVMGLGNAATPFGIRAMQELDRLNTCKGTATNAMVMFLAINTSGVAVLPTGVIGLRAAAGSLDPAAVLPTTLFATTCSTVVAVIAVKFFQRFFPWQEGKAVEETAAEGGAVEPLQEMAGLSEGYPSWVSWLAFLGLASLIPLTIIFGKALSPWIMPSLVMALLLFGFMRKVRVYEVFVDGAKDGFQLATRIIPYLVAILVAVGMFRASGGMDGLVAVLAPITSLINLPAEALPMALMRPLSGSGAFAVLASTIQNPAIGPDSYTGILVSTLQGSSETTFYVLAVYFGAVQVHRIRHALAAGLAADLAGVLGAVAICSWLYLP
ncbi:MAG: spore maturation protein [Magnetococcales bacterium]|nr:spore maturation protein [Magnetococcales bacterium]NGZ25762.1 spore maturation protein [Magnetococcales bacterium]